MVNDALSDTVRSIFVPSRLPEHKVTGLTRLGRVVFWTMALLAVAVWIMGAMFAHSIVTTVGDPPVKAAILGMGSVASAVVYLGGRAFRYVMSGE